MVEFLHGLHSGVRYLVLLSAVVALVLAVAGLRRRDVPSAAGERVAMAVFVGLLDLQVVLGVLLLLFWPFYGALIGHIVMMVLAAVAAHGGSIMARRRQPPASASPVRLVAIGLALVLIVGGIMAIQRSVI